MAKHKSISDTRKWGARTKGIIAFAGTLLVILFIVAMNDKFNRDSKSEKVTGAEANPSGVVKETDIAGLKNEFFELNQNLEQQKTTKRLEILDRQIGICQTILRSGKTPEDLVFGKRWMLKCVGTKYAFNVGRKLDLQGVDVQFLELAKSLTDDADPQIRVLANRAILEKAMIDIGGQDDALTPAKQVVPEIMELAKKFPDDLSFVYSLGKLADIYKFNPDKRDATIIVIEALISGWESNTIPLIQEWISSLRDEVKLLKHDFFTKFGQATDGDESVAAEMINSIPTLLESGLGVGGINQVLTAAEQFEMNDWYGQARSIYNLVLEHLKSTSVLQKENLITKASYGITRINLLGTKLKFADIDVNGNTLSSDVLEKKVGLVMYFESVSQLDQLAPLQERLSSLMRNGLVCVATFGSRPSSVDYEKLKLASSGFRFVVDEKADSSLFKACPIAAAPYYLITNREGIVVDINVSLKEMIVELENLVFVPNQE